MRSEGEVLAVIVFFVTLVFGIGIGAAQLAESTEHNSCHRDGELINQKVTYRKWNGCYVNQNNTWVPLEVWKWNRNNDIDMSKVGE